MRRSALPMIGLILALPAAAYGLRHADLGASLFAVAEAPAMLEGCGDVPEAVALAGELNIRALRIERYMEELENRKREIAEAEITLKNRLAELKSVRDGMRSQRTTDKTAVQSDIDRLVAVYDQMKPAEAAAVIGNLPPDFAAEILMRVQPEAGARIIAAVAPEQAAMLTTHMGARSAKKR